MKITDQAGLTKAAKTIHEHLEKHMEMHKALHEKLEGQLAKDHPILKAHQAMMDHCEKCMKAARDTAGGEEPEKALALAPPPALDPNAEAITKAVTAALAPLTAEVEALKTKLAATPANVLQMPHTGATAVAKSIDTDAAFGELIAK